MKAGNWIILWIICRNFRIVAVADTDTDTDILILMIPIHRNLFSVSSWRLPLETDEDDDIGNCNFVLAILYLNTMRMKSLYPPWWHRPEEKKQSLSVFHLDLTREK